MDSAMSGLATGRMLELSEHFLASPPLVVKLITSFGLWSWVVAERLYTLLCSLLFLLVNNIWHGHAWNACRKETTFIDEHGF